ncbi:alpha/beta fold hydrolase [Sphingobacterium sp. SRCM116780]|uniref:alpha/beta hydrolase n=1 Tax=Sphingobacterium sp. SRCM116780 TaxID=2907623 RepID=UPI001F235221|nr:alpha/beta fold hydrolase [Sphingobacterium sp. SRCM116780]UIR57697.1 alpha/beta fold hydrolase [Sphingobacterium sp. SRCM116780]
MRNRHYNRNAWLAFEMPSIGINASIWFAIMLCFSSCSTIKDNNSNLMVIKEQGSFMVGGTKTTQTGTFDLSNALKPQGQTFHGDHAYAFYQIPEKAHKLPLVFLHGAGQSKKTWETTTDGREGFQNIFLKRDFAVYLLDQPRRGDAGKSSVEATITPTPDEQFWFTQFRIGNYPDYFQNVQFPKDAASLEQFYRQMTPNTGSFDAKVITDAVSQLFDKIGEGILVTHSQGGGPGWLTAIKNDKVKAVVAYEPYSSFVFPEGELPAAIKSNGLFGALTGVEIPVADFNKLTKIPIVIYYGDNIAKESTKVWNEDHWRSGLEMARIWAATINKHGGDATVVHLPEVGIKGNTHFAFADLNNIQVADELSKWLKEKELDK